MLGPLRLSQTSPSGGKSILLFNSASPWASTQDDLQALYDSPHTDMVTTRTAVLTVDDVEGSHWKSKFEENPSIHTHTFLKDILPTLEGGRLNIARGSLNSYGYSPHPLSQYLEWIANIWRFEEKHGARKPFMISLAGPPKAVGEAIKHVRQWTGEQTGEHKGRSSHIAVELNLSCPNIKDSDTPSGYDADAIAEIATAARTANAASMNAPQLAFALKLPPYTYPAQFAALITALESVDSDGQDTHPISFLTCVNTLGASFWLNPGRTSQELVKALPGSLTEPFDGTGGLAGESLHPIALGNVFTLRNLLRSSNKPSMRKIEILGVGGVMSGLSALRMKQAGASAIGLATALGREGVSVFERISKELTLLTSSDGDHAQ